MRLITTFMVFLVLNAATSPAGTNTWTSSGPEGAFVFRLNVDPADTTVLYAWTAAGIYRTVDGGGNWAAANDGLPGDLITAFAVGGGDPGCLYAAVNGSIWTSADRGGHWSRRGSLAGVQQLEEARRSGTLYAICDGDVGFLSRDGGITWSPAWAPVTSFVISATAVYAIDARASVGAAVVVSRDDGTTWTPVATAATKTLVATQDSDTVYGLFGPVVVLSDDFGENWAKLPLPTASVIYALVPNGRTVYVSTAAGVMVYDEGRKSWKTITERLDARNLTIVSSPSLRMYVTPQSGIEESVGGEWVPVSHGLPSAVARDVAISIKYPSTAYAATNAGNFISDDGGSSWKEFTGTPFLQAIAVNPETPDTAFAGTLYGLRKTLDHGRTWKTVSASIASRLAISPADPATLYAVLAAGLAKSSDNGESWNLAMNGLDLNYFDFYYGFSTQAMAVNPSNAQNVAIARYDGLFTTTDGGASWQRGARQLAFTLAIDSSSAIYAGDVNRGVVRSDDGGGTFRPAGLRDKLIATLEASGSTLYAGTSDGHVYRSDDGGQFWSGFDDGLRYGGVERIVVDASGEHLYAATIAGVFEYDIAEPAVTLRRFGGDPLHSLRDLLSGAAFVLPVAGNAQSGNGTIFTSDVTLTNRRDVPQRAVLVWLPQGGELPEVFGATLPVGDARLTDMNAQFAVTGIGSLAVFAVTEEGGPDSDGAIDGSARIWNHPADGRAPFSQSIGAAQAALLAPHAHASIESIAQDLRTRVNVGVVNLSDALHQFTIGSVTFAVPALSLVQVPLPDGQFDSIDAFADSGNVRWIVYGSAIDRVTGETRTVLGQINE